MLFSESTACHLAQYPRLHPLVPQLEAIGYLGHKKDVIDHPFTTVNFSFILSGEGFYTAKNGKKVTIKAPCVITQWPAAPMNYGPHPEGEWEELYLIYNATWHKSFEKNNFILPSCRWWNIDNFDSLQPKLEEFAAIFQRIRENYNAGDADRLDSAAYQILLESVPNGKRIRSIHVKNILEVKSFLDANYFNDQDFDKIADNYGYSPATFRRLWQDYTGMPPHRYLLTLRIRYAQQMLAESTMRIGDIARRLKYDDVLFFSRQFRKYTGMSARQYRNRYSSPLLLKMLEE